jgi:hypothetical protein
LYKTKPEATKKQDLSISLSQVNETNELICDITSIEDKEHNMTVLKKNGRANSIFKQEMSAQKDDSLSLNESIETSYIRLEKFGSKDGLIKST